MTDTKVLFLSDPHWTGKLNDEYRFELFETVNKMIVGKEIHSIIIPGDLTVDKDHHPAPLVNKICKGLIEWSRLIPGHVFIVMGNHDIAASQPFFEFLGEYPGIFYFNQPAEFRIEKQTFLFLPHTKTPQEEWKNFVFDNKIAVAHVTVDGAFTESGYVMESQVDSKIFDTAMKAYSGDIHKPQKCGALQYIGCPYNIRYGDDFTGRALILNLDDMLEEEVLLHNFPRRLVIDCSSASDVKTRLDFYKTQENILYAQVKIRLHLDQKNMGDWRQIKQDIYSEVLTMGYELLQFEISKEKLQTPVLIKQTKHSFDFDQYCNDHNISEDLKIAGAEIIGKRVFARLQKGN